MIVKNKKSALAALLVCAQLALPTAAIGGAPGLLIMPNPNAGNTDTVPEEVDVISAIFDGYSVGGICTKDGDLYFTDRHSRALYVIEDFDSVIADESAELKPTLLIGRTDLTDTSGRTVTGWRDGRFTSASFGEPRSVVPYRTGLLIADRENNSLRYVNLSRKRIYTLAGGGEPGFVDGVAREAQFSYPSALAIGDDGLIYVADSGNHAIRCVDTSGEVTTFIGGEEGSALGALADTRLSYPSGICFNEDTLYIADSGNHRIIAVKDGQSTLVAGAALTGDAALEGDLLNAKSESARFAEPMAIAVDGDVIYVADSQNSLVRVIKDGYVDTLEGEFDAPLVSPDLFFESDGKLYVVDGFHRTSQALPEYAPTVEYTDTEGSEYTDAIRFVTANKLMNGTGGGKFSPDGTITRGMIVTILARRDGMDTTLGENWYDIGVQWGLDNGVSDGTNPERNITYEQLLTMLHRYAGEPELETEVEIDANVSEWALAAVKWATGLGITDAVGEKAPKSNPTRAETAAILMGFLLTT